MAYPPITPLPTPPSRQDPANFATEADAFLGALPTFQTEINAAGVYVEDTAAAVSADAVSAASSATAASQIASVWVSGGSYTLGGVAYSPITFATYRAKTTHSGLTTDPSLDTTNWANLSGAKTLTDLGVVASSAELNFVDGVTSAIQTQINTKANSTQPTLSKATLNDGYTEEVFVITDGASVVLDPNNGSIQTWTLGASRTPDQANWAAGQSIVLMVDDGTSFSITWSTLAVVWETNGGVAPTLSTSGFSVIVLWKVGTTIYGARVGDV